MFLNIAVVTEALENLRDVHPFYILTFLVFKYYSLPVGDSREFPVNREEKKFLDEYYKPNPQSGHYYLPPITAIKDKHWVSGSYPSSTSQSTRTRGRKAAALIHDTTTKWGWQENYLDILQEELFKNKPIPAFYLASWLYRERNWPSETSAADVLNTFFAEFNITEEEKQRLFYIGIPEYINPDTLFQPKPVSLQQLKPIIGSPPDVAEGGGTLAYLELKGVGPAPALKFEPAKRINLITGDNGLGKTFLLECAWWALTGQWVGLPAYPLDDAATSEIIFQIAGETITSEKVSVRFDRSAQTWPTRPANQTIPGLLIYARADNSFAIWDPTQHYQTHQSRNTNPKGSLVFDQNEVWDGLEIKESAKTRIVCNGLIRDWVSWQSNPGRSPFDTLTKVLARLSPQETALKPGKPTRIFGDAREFPTVALPYGEVPVIHASAGMRRILALAYLIVWAWNEHKSLSEMAKEAPQRRMVIVIDEIEAHLHPRWQRLILPSTLEIQGELDLELEVQFLIATHSPLVMASVEPIFNEETDKLFHLDLVQRDLLSSEVKLEAIDFVRLGEVDAWLTSNVFELRAARSVEAEDAIEAAKALQLEESPDPEEVQLVTDQLIKYLASDDEFWPRWTFFAEQHGVHL